MGKKGTKQKEHVPPTFKKSEAPETVSRDAFNRILGNLIKAPAGKTTPSRER